MYIYFPIASKYSLSVGKSFEHKTGEIEMHNFIRGGKSLAKLHDIYMHGSVFFSFYIVVYTHFALFSNMTISRNSALQRVH